MNSRRRASSRCVRALRNGSPRAGPPAARGRPAPPRGWGAAGRGRAGSARRGGGPVEVRRIAEHVQVDADLMADLKSAGIVPGQDVDVDAIARFGDAVLVASNGA